MCLLAWPRLFGLIACLLACLVLGMAKRKQAARTGLACGQHWTSRLHLNQLSNFCRKGALLTVVEVTIVISNSLRQVHVSSEIFTRPALEENAKYRHSSFTLDAERRACSTVGKIFEISQSQHIWSRSYRIVNPCLLTSSIPMNHTIFIANEGIQVNLGILVLAVLSTKAGSQNVVSDEVNVLSAKMEWHFNRRLPWIRNQERLNCIEDLVRNS